MTLIVVLVLVFAFGAILALLSLKVPPWVYHLICAVVFTGVVILCLFPFDSTGAAINSFWASIHWYQFWKKKPPRMRDRVAKLIGAKARAVRDRLVKAMPKASPVRSPKLAPAGT